MIKKFCTNLRIAATALLTFSACGNFANAQGCGPATSSHFLDINNIRARINNGGDMFSDHGVFGAQFNVPKVIDPLQPKKNTIYSSSLWIGAYSKGKLKAAAMTYRQSGVDFFAGPVDTINGNTIPAECQKWDKVWRINRSTIDSFKSGLFSAIPPAIQDWPAHGDASRGQAKQLAPFVDVNGNGIYEPAQGDYPEIKGDQMLWWVFNDKGNIHQETGADQLGVEVHASAYAYNKPQDIPLYNTIFVDYKIYNRSNKDRLDSLYVGNFTDFDLGFAFDDYLGTDSALNAYYVYNGDPDDEGIRGYGQNPPSQAVILLNRKLNKFVYYNNDYTVTGNPTSPQHFYNYLAGRWKDGQPLTFGGDGRSTSNIPANFMFPGNPTSTDLNDWNEKTSGNEPGDRRGLGSTGPLYIEPGASERFTFAYVYTRNTEGGSTGAINQLKKDLTQVKTFYDNNIVTNLPSPQKPAIVDVSVYPNPANEQIFISSGNLFTTSVRLINAVGQQVAKTGELKGTLNAVSIKDLPKGFYTVIVETKECTVAKKLVISR